jgi:hypothetical protein
MAGHELRSIFLVPFKCPHCRTENDCAAAWVIEHGKLRCHLGRQTYPLVLRALPEAVYFVVISSRSVTAWRGTGQRATSRLRLSPIQYWLSGSPRL